MSRAKLDLTGLDDRAPREDEAVLREISEKAGFPSRPAVPAPPASAAAAAPRAVATGFQRPVKQNTGRNIAMNVRVGETTASRMYALRDFDPDQKASLADVIDEAVELLYAKRFPEAS
jgi:hypothetical protein